MAEDKIQDYSDKSDEGHVDTREQNFDCEKPDKNLGCDLGHRCSRIVKTAESRIHRLNIRPKKGRAFNEALPFFVPSL